MATFNKFNTFVLNVGSKKLNLASDQIVVALCAAANAPVATNSVLSDLTQISYTNCSTRNATTTSFTQSSGTATLILVDQVLTASGGNIAAFRYVVLYDDTATNDELIGWYDYGADVTITNGNTFTVDFNGSTGVLTIA